MKHYMKKIKNKPRRYAYGIKFKKKTDRKI